MKLKAQLDGHEYELTLELNGQHAVADVNGRKYQLYVHQSINDNYLIFDSGRVFECSVSTHHGSHEAFDVAVRGNNYSLKIIDPRRLRTNEDSDRDHDGTAEIIAPMPGKIVRVLVAGGERVEAGTALVVVEAMKMQNEMKSPRAGVVTSMNVAAGDTVEAGALLAVIE